MVYNMLSNGIENTRNKFNIEIETKSSVEMTKASAAEKQKVQQMRIKCLVLVQTFFAGLGDEEEPLLEVYTKQARRIKQNYDGEKKEFEREEREKVKKEHMARQQKLQGLPT